MNSTFSGHFGYRRLLRVTLPSIVMMIFMEHGEWVNIGVAH